MPPPLSFLGGGTPMPTLVPNYPNAQTAFDNKYKKLAPALPSIPLPVRNSLINFDMKRVIRGQNPLPLPQTAAAIQAAITGQAVTQPAAPSPWEAKTNAVRNVKDLTSSLHPARLISGLFNEAKEVVEEGPETISRALSAGGPTEVIQALAESPGIRLIPGSYIAGNVAEGPEGWKELAANPVFTALDALPVVNKLAKVTPVAKAYEAQRAGLKAAGKFTPTMSPIRSNLAYKLVDDTLEPRLATRGFQALSHTIPGRMVDEAFSQQARAASRIGGRHDIEYKNLISPEGLPNESPLIFATRRGQELQRIHGLDDARVAELKRLGGEGDVDVFARLPENEQAYLVEARGLGDRILAETLQLPNDLKLIERGGEIYDNATGTRLNAIESRLTSARHKVTTKLLPKLEEIYAANGDPRIRSMINDLYDNNFVNANRTLTGLLRGKTRLDRPQGVARGRNVPRYAIAPADIQLGQIGNLRGDLRKAVNLETTLDNAVRTSVPARWQTIVAGRAAESYAAKLRQSGAVQIVDETQAAQLAESILARDTIDIPGFDAGDLKNTVDEISRTWRTMRDTEGLNPMFVHRVSEGKLLTAQHAGVMENIPSLSQVKERVADVSPSVNDIGLSVSHQGMEILARQGSEAFVRDQIAMFGVENDLIRQRYSPAARVAARTNPRIDFESHLSRIIGQEYERFNPRSMITWSTKNFADNEQVWMPKTVVNNMKRAHAPTTYKLTALINPITHAFRTAILPLSPRWHVYNITGGAMTLSAHAGPAALKYMPEAMKIVKALGKGDTELAQAAGIPREVVLALGGTVREAEDFAFRAGGTSARLFKEIAEAKVPAIADKAQYAAAKFKAFTDASFKVNQLFDDAYRVMGYIAGKNKGLGEEAAIGLSRKIIQQWDEYTPIERQLLRHIFPFYGFSQHILRMAFKYPVEHPFRTAVMGGLVRTELEDLGTGLPHSFLNSFFLGGMDENGKQNAISLQGMNPFSDVGNLMTLSGWAAASNPAINTILQQMGVDGGRLELYPNLRYDPSTGQLTAKSGNVFQQFAHNVIPQTEVLEAMLGTSSEFKEMLKTDPDAAWRTIRSQSGLPIVFRTYNLPAEYFKNEVRRQEDEDTARTDALKSGDYSYANRFPGLIGLMDQVKALQASGAITDFQPTYTIPAYESQLTGLRK